MGATASDTLMYSREHPGPFPYLQCHDARTLGWERSISHFALVMAVEKPENLLPARR